MHRALDKDAVSWLYINDWICNFDLAMAIHCAAPYLGHKKPVTGAKAPQLRLQLLLFIYNNCICSVQSGLIPGWQLHSVVCSSLISYRLLPCCFGCSASPAQGWVLSRRAESAACVGVWEEQAEGGHTATGEAAVRRRLWWQGWLCSPPFLMCFEHWNLGMLARAGARKEWSVEISQLPCWGLGGLSWPFLKSWISLPLSSQNRFFHVVCKRLIDTQSWGIWLICSSV